MMMMMMVMVMGMGMGMMRVIMRKMKWWMRQWTMM